MGRSTEFYGQIEYHLGWRTVDLTPAELPAGKLLRPTLLLLACELAAGYAETAASWPATAVRRALPAAVAVELLHNFSFVHDDIEDGDEVRHHRPTLWRLWGIPQAINTGDGIYALARLQLWRLSEQGVAAATVLRMGELFDRTALELCEGQFLDLRAEGQAESQHDVTVALYLAMIERKTAALMACATEMGFMARRAGFPDLASRLGEFGRQLGVAFQLRDDLLGIWQATELGKSAAGDLRRKKMSLPIISALECAAPADRAMLAAIYSERGPASDEQIARLLDVLERAGSRATVRRYLGERCAAAGVALRTAASSASPAARAAMHALEGLLALVAAEAE